MSTPWLRYANQGATRNMPLDPRLASALGFLGEMGVTAEVYSGGQPAKGTSSRRVGSTRHDLGNAGDFRFYRDGRQLDWANEGDRPVFEDIVRRGRAAGITGFGAGPGYMGAGTMHVGFGAPGVWGAGGRGANAPEWLRSAYYGAAGEAGAMARAPAAPGGASGALETALLDRGTAGPSLPSSATAYASDGVSPMASRPMLKIGPERSNELAEAMIARASADAQNMTHPLQLLGNLAQVWSGNQQIRANDKANQDELEKALMGAGLDPSYALAAQLGGGRDDLAGALLAQQSDRSQAANRAEDQAWRQQQFEYQAGQDAMANERAGAALDLQRQNAERGSVPAGYRATATGLEPIPGGPADPATRAGGGTEYGLTPQYGVDAQGNPVVIQLGKNGTSIQTPLPEGVALSREPIRLDAGTHFVLLDPVTRQPVGQVPKENYQEGYESAAGAAQGKADVEKANEAPSSMRQAEGMIASIDGVLNDPNLSLAVGVGSMIPAVPGSPIPGTRARIEQLGGQAFLQAFESLKGGGQITEVEGLKATQAIARLNTAQSEADFRAALNELREVVDGARQRAASVQAPQPNGQRYEGGIPVGGSGAPAPAEQRQRRFVYDPATGEFK